MKLCQTAQEVETWGRLLERKCSQRVKTGIQNSLEAHPSFCLEHAYAEMESFETYKDAPRVIQRARVFETYLKNKTIAIRPYELLVGDFTSGIRNAPFFGEYYYQFVTEDLDDPVRDFQIRGFDEFILTEQQRKELRETILPYFKNRCFQNHVFNDLMDPLVQEKTCPMSSNSPTVPVLGQLMLQTDLGHTFVNFPKVLKYGLEGIKEEVLYQRAKSQESYCTDRQRKLDEYDAMLICLDAAIAYANRYAALARELAEKEPNPTRQAELLEIARVCEKVPAKPAESFREAMQVMTLIHILAYCEVINVSLGFGRVDQFLFPYYQKSVLEDRTMTRDEAVELLELWFIKLNELTEIYNYDNAQTQMGFSLTAQMTLGGQTRDGKDAVNELSYVILDAEEQVGLREPDFGIRVFPGSDRNFLKRAAEVIRLGRGKPKYFFDSKALECMATGYPDLPIEDLRDYVTAGCTELFIPYVTALNSYVMITNVPKIIELTLNNGRCALTGQQLGPMTGDVRTFKSIGQFKNAFERQLHYWVEMGCRAVKVEMDAQATFSYSPFNSALLEGPIQQGKDMVEGGCWNSTYGCWFAGIGQAADALTSIDTLIFREKKVDWDTLLQALKADWNGFEMLRAYDINQIPKYGNDNDYPDSFASYIMDTWCDIIDEMNTRKELLPEYGGRYICSSIVATSPTMLGTTTGALPGGRKAGMPLSDTSSPEHGMDRHGISAVIKSNAKLPQQRNAMGNCLNQRLSPQMVATDEDVERFVDYIQAIDDLSIAEIQFNIISSSVLKKAMAEPEQYRDLLVRVASYSAYFVEMSTRCQQDIIDRTEQENW